MWAIKSSKVERGLHADKDGLLARVLCRGENVHYTYIQGYTKGRSNTYSASRLMRYSGRLSSCRISAAMAIIVIN